MGILAHVDSGKTTLSEALLYTAGELRKLGRVDHKNAFLDTNILERERGITIFSKQAQLHLPDTEFVLLDTPGHVDFSAEMERTLQVLDYAILVISGSEGIQSHTETLWKLLQHSHVPVFLFINKMDLALKNNSEIMSELLENLDTHCVDFSERNTEFFETLGTCDEMLMEEVLETGIAEPETIAQAILQRHVFPCCFGSALKLQGIAEFLELLQNLTLTLPENKNFGAKVYKIAEDEQGKRLTYLKITGGVLHVRDMLNGMTPDGTEWQEKINQIRIYSGAKFQPVDEVFQGSVCAVTGLTQAYSGEGFGIEKNSENPILEPILQYSVILPTDISIHTALIALRKLEQEDPQLHVSFSSQLQEIHVLLMGEIQLAVLQHILKERFDIQAEFQPGGVVYKETIKNKVEGMGHYEPLKHFAEVRVLLEPAKAGTGLQFSSICREDVLDRNWQRLILSHFAEKQHVGVLTGSPITDMKITLVSGKEHKKHTEGGDFRQATYRAIRQGLMQAETILLEPYYQFRLEVPSGCIGRAITDLQCKGAEFSQPELQGDSSILEGKAPATVMMQYRTSVMEYTKGRGKLTCMPCGYAPCANPEEVIAKYHYHPEADLENSPDSIFCSHGTGFLVKWNEVQNYMQTESYLKIQSELKISEPSKPVRTAYTGSFEQDEELMKIYEKTYGKIHHDKNNKHQALHTPKNNYAKTAKIKPMPKTPEYLLVDGYNIIFGWQELKKIADKSLDMARAKLIQKLSNYQGMRQCKLIIVFDAYKLKGNTGSLEQIGDISIVYTREAETADSYIERVTHELSREHRVRVATSDGMEQMIILGNGAYRMSAEELRQEVENIELQMQEYLQS
ncbi:MAG: GTP-binding protein [Ruminococcus sp.]|nr:GTP-binding protein [Ruminococcus sp.]